MVEIWPVVKIIGLANIGMAPSFRQIYGKGDLASVTIDYIKSFTISSSDMNLIAPPNCDLRLARVSMFNNDSAYSRWGSVNDVGILLGANSVVHFIESLAESANNLAMGSRTFNYIAGYSEVERVLIQFWYYFNTPLVDYARTGKWTTDSFEMTKGDPFSYIDFSTTSTSYVTLLQSEFDKILEIKKAGFWLGLWVSAAGITGYLKCDISNDGTNWTTLWETSTTSTTEVAIKYVIYDLSFKFIRYQAKTTGGTVYFRVRELHYWGERVG